jgi:hypothetical protein
MTATAPTRPAPAARGSRRMPMGRRTRQAVLVVHLLSAAAWIGVDVVVAVLVGAGWAGGDPTTRGLAYQALGSFTLAPMLGSALVCLASGLLLGLATRWGLVRYWWVLVKFVLTVLLCTLIVVALRPQLPEVVEAGEAISVGGSPAADLASLVFPPAVSLSLLSLAVVLSVVKPWGRVRRDAPVSAGPAPASPAPRRRRAGPARLG